MLLDSIQRRAIHLVGDDTLTNFLTSLECRRKIGDLSLLDRYSNSFEPSKVGICILRLDEGSQKSLYNSPTIYNLTVIYLTPAELKNATVKKSLDHDMSVVRKSKSDKDDYDFIVVGSGSAGSVIASRLSENPQWRILLLEAGTRANSLTEIPLLAPVFQLTPYNWGYRMERQEGVCNAMEEGVCNWPRGRALGGTSVINYMIYTRGNPGDFERWEGQGNPGWSYDEVIQYYLKSEDCHLGKECQSRYHQNGGYLSIEYPFTTELTNAFIRAVVDVPTAAKPSKYPYKMSTQTVQPSRSYVKR
ncbi:unnamed protein product [Phaedon cochleariae]|uniref:Glucose-methanol-choline oxidoreductase N-terminal domain-containing protein n=1 Tax=Phaedon cochleariae TaxID=80249 RepID=A0A9N9SEZ6_PHACE|nr:unnamed protein product [Phaedon cochleariae]